MDTNGRVRQNGDASPSPADSLGTRFTRPLGRPSRESLGSLRSLAPARRRLPGPTVRVKRPTDSAENVERFDRPSGSTVRPLSGGIGVLLLLPVDRDLVGVDVDRGLLLGLDLFGAGLEGELLDLDPAEGVDDFRLAVDS